MLITLFTHADRLEKQIENLARKSLKNLLFPFSFFKIRSVDIDTVVTDELYHCDSKYRQKILWIIYLYKSLFLVVGGYLAAKTRHVHIAALNDSKFIVWSIYTVVLTSLFTFLVMISIKNLLTYVFLSFVVILMTTFILCLVFVPKVNEIRARKRFIFFLHSFLGFTIEKSTTRRYSIERLVHRSIADAPFSS